MGHFQLYYGDDIPDMRQWRATQRKKKKKTKKKMIRVKKVKPKKVKKVIPPTEGESEPVAPSNNTNGESTVNELTTEATDGSILPENGVQESEDMEVDDENEEGMPNGDNSSGVVKEGGEEVVADGAVEEAK